MRDKKFFETYSYNQWKEYIQYRIKAVMNQRDLTAHKLSVYSGLSDSAISRYVNGTNVPSLRAACNISYALNLSPTYLFAPYDFSRHSLYEPYQTYENEVSIWPRTLSPIKYNWLSISAVKLQWLAKDYRLSQRQIGKILDIPQPMISRYFNGLSEPSLENAMEFLWLFDAKFEDIWYYNVFIGD